MHILSIIFNRFAVCNVFYYDYILPRDIRSFIHFFILHNVVIYAAYTYILLLLYSLLQQKKPVAYSGRLVSFAVGDLSACAEFALSGYAVQSLV